MSSKNIGHGYWANEAKTILRAELERRGVTYALLVRLLKTQGVEETERAIANKISRGSFSFAFFLQVIRAIDAEEVNLKATQRVEGVLYTGPAGAKKRNQDGG